MILKIAVYGKGGVGKSVVATNLSATFAKQGRSVLHLGCDPKHDSAVRLVDGVARISTVLEVMGDNPTAVSAERIIRQGRLGIHCCESGGPSPGLGCGGRGVARTLEFIEETGLFESGAYQVVIFDVLGDVVCGGFAAPLRRGFAERVVIVTSEEPMAMYAANNISRAISVYQANGVFLSGLVVNLRGDDSHLPMLEEFARRLSTSILAVVPRDAKIQESEKKRRTVVENAPEAASSLEFARLAKALEEKGSAALPTPMDDEEFYRFVEQW